MKWSREEYLELMTFGKVDRPMFVEQFGLLIGLDKEWEGQCASKDEVNLTAFDFDYVDVVQCGGNSGLFRGISPRILEDTEEYTISIDEMGRTTKLCKKTATIPLPLDFPVKDMDSWLKIKGFFEYHQDRINWNQVELAKKAQKEGAVVIANINGGFDLPRELMGEEMACLGYYDQPDLMINILETAGNTACHVLEKISDSLIIDNLVVHEDMAGKSGPLIGPNLVREFIKPYYGKVWDMLFSKGTRLFSQDSDGNMLPVIDAFMECGINIMFPMEPTGGMDIVEVRKKYGNKLAFKGGIDKHVLRQGKEDIRKELEDKMQPLMRDAGIVFGLDHRIPNGTPLENYRYYVDTAREILGIPPRDCIKKGWGHMAF